MGRFMVTTPSSNGERLLPRRVGTTRTMLPSTWLGRGLKIEYVGGDSVARETTGVLLDWCPVGMLVLIAGAKTLLSWDRVILAELQED